MFGPRTSRLRLALTVLLLFVSQLTVFTTNLRAMCAPSDCDQGQTAQPAGISVPTEFPATAVPAIAGIFAVADVSTDAPLNPADQGGCHAGASACSLLSPGVPVFADVAPAIPGALRTVISNGPLPPNAHTAPPHRPPRA